MVEELWKEDYGKNLENQWEEKEEKRGKEEEEMKKKDRTETYL